MNVLIIEDERKAAQELKALVLALRPHWHVVGILPSAAEAIHWLTAGGCPDLIFSDIQLTDAVCFYIFKIVPVKCPIIFCTAYDEYAIQAFETNGIDYLLKPIDKARLERSLDKLDTFRAAFAPDADARYPDIGKLLDRMTPNAGRSILVYDKNKIIPVDHADIAFFYYEQGTVTIRLLDGGAYSVNQGIDEVEHTTDPRLFYRANRQFLINRHAIRDIERFFGRKLVVKTLVNAPEPIIISKAKTADFLGWLEAGGR